MVPDPAHMLGSATGNIASPSRSHLTVYALIWIPWECQPGADQFHRSPGYAAQAVVDVVPMRS